MAPIILNGQKNNVKRVNLFSFIMLYSLEDEERMLENERKRLEIQLLHEEAYLAR